MQGWIKLHRELMEKPIWTTSNNNQRILLVIMLMKANHEQAEWEYKREFHKVEPGQFVTSLDKLKKEANMTAQAVRTAIDKFARYGFLTNKSTKTGRVISIINWETYQAPDKMNNKDKNSDATKIQQSCNKDVTPNKNVKNVKNDNNNKEGKDIYTQAIKNIIDYLNLKLGAKFKHNSKIPIEVITARLKEDHKENEFFIVIDKKVNEWINTDMAKHLVPQTLFGNKFDQYLNAPIPVQQVAQRKPTTGEENVAFLKNHYKENQCNQNQSLIK